MKAAPLSSPDGSSPSTFLADTVLWSPLAPALRLRGVCVAAGVALWSLLDRVRRRLTVADRDLSRSVHWLDDARSMAERVGARPVWLPPRLAPLRVGLERRSTLSLLDESSTGMNELVG